MPNKYNDARRHRIPKMTFKVTNWSTYEAGLRRRGSLTLWVSDEAIAAWGAPPRKTPGGQARTSEPAIETALMVRLVFHQPLRQPEGLLGSLLQLMAVDLPVPDHTTISRRAARLTPVLRTALPDGPVTLVIDSTGLKVYGAGEWHRDKHGVRGRRTWRKLHLAVDAATNTIVTVSGPAPRSIVVFAPISTSSSTITLPSCGTRTKPAGSMAKPKPSCPIRTPG